MNTRTKNVLFKDQFILFFVGKRVQRVRQKRTTCVRSIDNDGLFFAPNEDAKGSLRPERIDGVRTTDARGDGTGAMGTARGTTQIHREILGTTAHGKKRRRRRGLRGDNPARPFRKQIEKKGLRMEIVLQSSDCD